MTDASPAFDVVLFGPTGVTGREVARHLHRRAPELGLTWAVAGRDRDRIERSLASVGAEPADILHADTDDRRSIEDMVGAAKVVADLVGPFGRHGEPVYAACARAGTHCIDPCGEIDWVLDMIRRYDDRATESGAIIVPTAGFEALPFDLGALLAAHLLHERTGLGVASVDVAVTITSDRDLRVRSAADAVSGGTFASGMEQIRRGRPEVSDPHVLDTRAGRSGRYDLRPRKHSGTGRWLSPMVPSPFLNPPVVHRSASLLRDSGDTIHAADFEYREGVDTAGMLPGLLAAPAAVAGSLLAVGMGTLTGAREKVRRSIVSALERVGPSPGDGPRPEDLDRWRYRLDVRAVDTSGGTQDVVVEADGHPGYKSTATILGEAALALADPEAPTPDGAGFLTPATALGLEVLDRFEQAGMRIRPA
ncbi:saccharopine dehydrogenase NADP-binding domain-containing protein [Acidimicrobiia bacterium EGI L10123]|uniref:saccharopine dehydrogenase family protein n=1 Tax=Salinilacustrithrix flava TaxID=2957203 RepID=UPI003D7C210C|nr:saccharopine dehydrogenase NADP-binding domain-containing protein [Acidimicrobiia bacterium EGI L10123]